MRGLHVQLPGGVHGPEKQRVAAPRLHGDAPPRARRKRVVAFVRLFARQREHRLAPALDVREVHQDGRDALAALFVVLVERVGERVHVRLVLLAHLVPQHLQALAVLHRDVAPLGDPALDVGDHLVRAARDERPVRGSNRARYALAGVVVHNRGLLKPRRGGLDDVVALRAPQEPAVEVSSGRPGDLRHLRRIDVDGVRDGQPAGVLRVGGRAGADDGRRSGGRSQSAGAVDARAGRPTAARRHASQTLRRPGAEVDAVLPSGEPNGIARRARAARVQARQEKHERRRGEAPHRAEPAAAAERARHTRCEPRELDRPGLLLPQKFSHETREAPIAELIESKCRVAKTGSRHSTVRGARAPMDYYEELGLSRSATDIDINKACVPVFSPSPARPRSSRAATLTRENCQI